MTFPATQAPVVVEIAPGADPTDRDTWSWQDITSYVRVSEGIFIEGGRHDEGSQVDTTSCRLTLDNRDGRFSPRNAEGQWYGQLSKNTPLRVRWEADSDAFGAAVSGGWGTSDTGRNWTTFGTGGTVTPSDFDVTGGEGVHRLEAAGVVRGTWQADTDLVDAEAQVTARVDLASVTGTVTATGEVTAGVMLRVTDTSNYLYAGVSVYPDGVVVVELRKMVDGVSTVIDDSTDLSDRMTLGEAWRIRAQVVGRVFRAKAWTAADDEPTGWDVTGTPHEILTGGGVGVHSSADSTNTNTKPVEVFYDDWAVQVDRFVGYVSEWPGRWSIRGNDAYTTVQAHGILRRLQQRTQPQLSAIRRAIPRHSGLVAYWPLEDGIGTTLAGSPVPGVEPMEVRGFTFEADSDLPGSAPLPTHTAGSSWSAPIPRFSGTEWQVAFAFNSETPVNTSTVLTVTTRGSVRTWQIRFATSTVILRAYDSNGTSIFETTVSAPTGFYERWGFLHLWAEQNGTGIDYTLRYRATGSIDVSDVVTGTITSETIGMPTRVSLGTRGSGAVTLAMGHMSVWDVVGNFGGYDAFFDTDSGYDNEYAQERLTRLLGENSIPFTAYGTEADTEDMGPEPIGTLLEVLRECETVDGGLLYELDGGLAYATRAGRYNQPVWMTLDLDSGHHAGELEPTDDDQRTVNAVTVTSPRGSFAHASDQDSMAAVGEYTEELAVNVHSDSQLQGLADWRLHLGTADELRWPLIPINLARNTSLTDAWLSYRPGARVQVSHTVTQLAGVDVDVLADGWTETIEPYNWRVELNCVPASPWVVGELDDTTLGRLDTAGSELVAAVDADDTTLTVVTTDGPTWTEDPGEFPFTITTGGEELSVTAIGPVLEDTFTRSTASGWGTADTGQTWATSGGAAGDYGTNGSLGFVTHLATGVRKFATIGSFADVELLTQIKVSATPSGANVIGGLVARYVDDNNSYHCWLVFTTTDGLVLTIAKRVAGAFTTLDTVTLGGTYSLTTFQWLRFSVIGDTLRAKTWQDGNREPGSYRLVATDTAFTAAGPAGVHSVLLTGNTSFPTFSWDNFTTVTPQTFTVTRSANGVSKSHSAGAGIHLAQPLTLAL